MHVNACSDEPPLPRGARASTITILTASRSKPYENIDQSARRELSRGRLGAVTWFSEETVRPSPPQKDGDTMGLKLFHWHNLHFRATLASRRAKSRKVRRSDRMSSTKSASNIPYATRTSPLKPGRPQVLGKRRAAGVSQRTSPRGDMWQLDGPEWKPNTRFSRRGETITPPGPCPPC